MYTIREIRIRNSPAERNRRRIVIIFSAGAADYPVELKEDFRPQVAQYFSDCLREWFRGFSWEEIPLSVKEYRLPSAVTEALRTQGKKIQADSS